MRAGAPSPVRGAYTRFRRAVLGLGAPAGGVSTSIPIAAELPSESSPTVAFSSAALHSTRAD